MMALIAGSLTGGGLFGIIAFVILLFKIPEAAWHGSLTRLTYVVMAIAAATLGYAAFSLSSRLSQPSQGLVELAGAALWGTACGSFFGTLFYRRKPA